MSAKPLSENIRNFATRRGIPLDKPEQLAMMETFEVYAKTAYANKFQRREEGDTMRIAISRMDDEHLDTLWVEFLNAYYKTLVVDGGTHDSKDRGRFV